MRIGSKSRKLIAIAGMFLLSLALVALGSSTQSATDRPNTGMADPDALINAFDRYVSGLAAAGGTRFLDIPLTSLRGLTSESFNAGGTVTNRPIEWLGGFSDPGFTVGRFLRPVVDRQPVGRRPNHVCRIPGCLAESRNLQLDIRAA